MLKQGTKPASPVALVTGGSGGLGQATAIELDRLGFRVAVHYNGNREKAEVVRDILHNDSLAVQADIGSWEAVETMVDQIESGLGSIDVVVNNAAIRNDNLMMSQRPEAWESVIRTNLLGTFHVTRRTLPAMMRRRWGRIINVVSPSGLIATPGQTAYAASKAGMIGMTKTLAAECGRRGVTVNALSPGFMPTGMTDELPDAVKDQMMARLLVPRFSTAEEVAASIGFFIDSAYMTGETISIDGGIAIS